MVSRLHMLLPGGSEAEFLLAKDPGDVEELSREISSAMGADMAGRRVEVWQDGERVWLSYNPSQAVAVWVTQEADPPRTT
jgi:hypothetical protein